MGVFDDLFKIDENGKILSSKWIEWKHIPMGFLHCQTCLSLDKCWFNNLIRPEIPQHERCHCRGFSTPTPIANVTAHAKCDKSKFTDYIFSDKYAWNGKRDLFQLLGFTIEDSDYLKQEYEKQAVQKYCNSLYKLGKLNEFGQRINIDIEFERNGRNIVFTSGWMVRPKGEIVNTTPLGD